MGEQCNSTSVDLKSKQSITGITLIRLWKPKIGDVSITCKEQLHGIIESHYPGLKRNPAFSRLLIEAEHHIELVNSLRNKEYLECGEIIRLARQFNAPWTTIASYVKDGNRPRLYYLIERCLSRQEAYARLGKLHAENNGIHSINDVKRRLDTYYLTSFHEKSRKHQRRLAQCNKYFKVLEYLKDGGCYRDVARILNVHHSRVRSWFKGQRPALIELARYIPSQLPAPKHKWLPLKMVRRFHPSSFIEIPYNISNYTQIKGVLNQLQPLRSDKINQYEMRFGPVSKTDVFFYLLGLMVSDFGKNKHSVSSTGLVLNLSKKYSWSEQLGEAVCYYLGKLGIYAEKGKDRDSSAGPKSAYSWQSQKTPFLTWMMHTCLGFQSHERTSYHPIQAEWILHSPSCARKAFLQGLSDGDGCASTIGQYISISSSTNTSFIKALLASFNIAATGRGVDVRIFSQDGIIRAAELPFFRFAAGRQQHAEKLAEMMRVRQQQEYDTISPVATETMIRLHDKGFSYGRIAEYIYDKFRVSLCHTSIMRRVKRRKGIDK